VYFTHWQGGGGYGDPLLREPEAVAADVIAHKVTRDAANEVYGVPLTVTTGWTRRRPRPDDRLFASPGQDSPKVDRRSTHEPVIDDNLEQHDDGQVTCRQCDQVLGDAQSQLRDARVTETAPQTAGPSVRESPSLFADRPGDPAAVFLPAVSDSVAGRNRPR